MCLTAGPAGGSGGECPWTVLLWVGVKTKNGRMVLGAEYTHMRGRASRVPQPLFGLVVCFFFFSVELSLDSWYVCRALIRGAFLSL